MKRGAAVFIVSETTSGPLRLPVHIGFRRFGGCYLKIMIHLFSTVAGINIYTYFIDLRLNMFGSAAHGLLLKILCPQLNIDIIVVLFLYLFDCYASSLLH